MRNRGESVHRGLAVSLAGCLLLACAIPDEASSEEEAAATEEQALLDGQAEGLDGDGEVTNLVNCSVVQWCDRPGSFDGTVCQQLACGVLTAVAECKRDVRAVCGARVCPFIFTSVTGARRDLCLE